MRRSSDAPALDGLKYFRLSQGLVFRPSPALVVIPWNGTELFTQIDYLRFNPRLSPLEFAALPHW
jgi:hypothetical protein